MIFDAMRQFRNWMRRRRMRDLEREIQYLRKQVENDKAEIHHLGCIKMLLKYEIE